MSLILAHERAQLRLNGRMQHRRRGTPRQLDFAPVVKLVSPGLDCTWLLTEIDIGDEDSAFGLVDTGAPQPALGHVRLSELAGIYGLPGWRVRRDPAFVADRYLSAYLADALRTGRVVA